jgi:hypothetical protein
MAKGSISECGQGTIGLKMAVIRNGGLYAFLWMALWPSKSYRRSWRNGGVGDDLTVFWQTADV